MEPPEDDPGSSGEQSAQSDSEASIEPNSGAEPGFGDDIAGADSLPDLRDEPRQEARPGIPSEASVTGAGDTGQSANQTDGTGSSDRYGGSGVYGSPTGMPAGGSGPLTPAEQVAILDAQLEKGAGEFDTIIMETQAKQRAAARAQAGRQSTPIGEGGNASGGGASEGNSPYEDDTANAGGYSTGGGMGGATVGGSVPQNTAKYPAPADIPNGNNDDVVARQLREAAMRESDPAVRERLWDEYRKYMGIEK